ncbi:hypothetical protein NC653_002029 [Populus alba x Populus x berolinensis]|uniref:Uncharacterized protein n=1 Tax=Populus alba x Populus x berolinensis TaxID=444605 RepID=A0AAD6RMP6_9ROSI|nr:hypothetical protein NC653_002029 [Populus alba x Populus x berolinensis]
MSISLSLHYSCRVNCDLPLLALLASSALPLQYLDEIQVGTIPIKLVPSGIRASSLWTQAMAPDT